MESNLLLLLQLLLGHLLTDFVLQSNTMIAHKRKHIAGSWYLYLHILLAGVLSYVCTTQWGRWEIIPIIAITHLCIDIWKLKKRKDNLRYFLIDQALHLAVLLVVWLYLINGFSQLGSYIAALMNTTKFMAILAGYVIVIFPVGFIIGKATGRWNKEISKNNKDKSLKNAGRYIGIFERVLVFTFIITGNFSAIGFLIGAKSILRFSDSKGTRKQTEYVLIGTLMSFSICIVVGLVVLALF